MEYMEATEKKDYDLILKKYNLKMRKNNKTVSPMRVKLEVKKAIIRMAFNDPLDLFDYDSFVNI
jgi:hypothetical protein